MRNSIYDDDSSYPGKSEEKSNSQYSRDDEIYEKQYEELVKRSNDETSFKPKTVLIIVLAVVGVIVVAIAMLMVFGGSKKESAPVRIDSSAQQTEDASVQSLIKKAEHYLEVGDYKSAEVIYNSLLDSESADDDVYTMHSVLFNFNKASDAVNEKDYSKAKRYSEKIPSDYVYYPGLSDDVDSLNSKIAKGEKAYDAFETIRDLMHAKKYADAAEEAEYIDEEYLSSEDRRTLEDYCDEIEEELEKNKPVSRYDKGYTSELSAEYVENFITSYCISFVDAINYSDFSIVETYMHPSSEMYAQQKKLLAEYEKMGLTERFDGLTLNSLRKINDYKWIASVTESETIYYSGGSQESNTYRWNYTIEYIDHGYYLTKISE